MQKLELTSLLRLFPFRGPISLHSFRLLLFLRGAECSALLHRRCSSGGLRLADSRLTLRRSAPPFERTLKGFNRLVKSVPLRNQQGDDLLYRHQINRNTIFTAISRSAE